MEESCSGPIPRALNTFIISPLLSILLYSWPQPLLRDTPKIAQQASWVVHTEGLILPHPRSLQGKRMPLTLWQASPSWEPLPAHLACICRQCCQGESSTRWKPPPQESFTGQGLQARTLLASAALLGECSGIRDLDSVTSWESTKSGDRWGIF